MFKISISNKTKIFDIHNMEYQSYNGWAFILPSQKCAFFQYEEDAILFSLINEPGKFLENEYNLFINRADSVLFKSRLNIINRLKKISTPNITLSNGFIFICGETDRHKVKYIITKNMTLCYRQKKNPNSNIEFKILGKNQFKNFNSNSNYYWTKVNSFNENDEILAELLNV